MALIKKTLRYMKITQLFRSTETNNHLIIGGVFCLFMLLGLSVTHAQTEKAATITKSATKSSGITQNQLKAKIDELNSKKGLEETTKSQLLSSYGSAQEYLTNYESYLQKTADYEAAITESPEKIKKIQKEIQLSSQKQGKQNIEDLTKISNEELEQRLIHEKEELASLDEELNRLEKELNLQKDRPQTIRQETLATQQQLEEVQKKLEQAASAPSKPENEAQRILQAVQIDSLRGELKMLSAEAVSNPVRVELLDAQLQLLTIQKDRLSPVVIAIENLVNSRRVQEAKHLETELTEAEKAASGKHSLIIQATHENIQFSRDLQAVTAKIESYTERKNKVESTASEIEADFKSAEKKIRLAGLSPVLGKILREQRRNLANAEQAALQSDDVQNETALASLEQFKIDDKLKLTSDMNGHLLSLINQEVDKSLPDNERMMIQVELRALLNNQKELLNKLSAAYTTYLRVLGDFDFAKQQMLAQVVKFATYLDERLLWVPSSAGINSDYIKGLYSSIKWLFSPHNWLALIKDIAAAALQYPFLTFIAIVGSILIPFLRSWSKRQLVTIASRIEKIYTDTFSSTLKALLYTSILVLPLPIFVYFSGWFLSNAPQVANFSKTVGVGLQSTAAPLFVLQFLFRLFASNGIAVKHFHWQKESASLLQRQIKWFRFIIIPGVFLINATGASLLSSYSDTLGRTALIANMVALSVFLSRLTNPQTGLFNAYITAHPNELFSKLRYVWYSAITVIPLIVVGFAIIGYYLSALELQQKLIVSLRFIFGIVVVYGMVIRWLTLVNRQLAIKNARQKRKSAIEEKQVSSSSTDEDVALPVEDQLVDIPTINTQTIKLLILFIGLSLLAGLWLIWSNILPAFTFLEHIVLWQHSVVVDDQETYRPITLTNLLMVGLYIFVIVVSVRNFPGLMELLVFSRLSIAPGGRYAVNQLARYFVITIGLICVANELGGSWSQVQWLVAALSVGLGFGLQEIFANLVSGIILLFERPIRVGDTVTINNVSGKVSRIQMRATTIMDWDHKEHIVPNKTFITSQLVNWTLSDTTTRIVIPLSIAFGSDVKLAHKLILECARSTPLVLEDPAPSVVFKGIKESAIEFSINVFVSELGHRQQVTHNLNLSLEKLLRENKFELPYMHGTVMA